MNKDKNRNRNNFINITRSHLFEKVNKIKFKNLCKCDQNNVINTKGNITTDIENTPEVVIKCCLITSCHRFHHLCLNNFLDEYTFLKLFQLNEEMLTRSKIKE